MSKFLKYEITNCYTGEKSYYTASGWNLAWMATFLFGVITGIALSILFS